MSAYEELLHQAVQNSAQPRFNPGHVVSGLFGPFRLISKLWSCWHRHMSRPFTRDGQTYRVCLRCGIQRPFDLDAWKTKGAYYREKKVSLPDTSTGNAAPSRTKLRLIA